MKIGTHKVKVVSPSNGWFCESSKGTAGIRIPLEIIAGECKGELTEYVAWISHAAIAGSMKTLKKAFSFNGDLRLLSGISDGPWVGKECEVVCEEQEYNGKVFVKIAYLNPVGGSGSALAKDATAALIAKLTAECMAAAESSQDDEKPAHKPKAAKADPDLDVLSDQEIPF